MNHYRLIMIKETNPDPKADKVMHLMTVTSQDIAWIRKRNNFIKIINNIWIAFKIINNIWIAYMITNNMGMTYNQIALAIKTTWIR